MGQRLSVLDRRLRRHLFQRLFARRDSQM